jgi:uncharacterized protein (TIGR02217 family)
MPSSLLIPAWNENDLLIFPGWCLEKIAGSEDFDVTITGRGKREKRNTALADGWQRASLAGGFLQGEDELLEWKTFVNYLRGPWKSFLFKNRFHCLLNNSHFGTGDGITTQFQLKLKGAYQGQSAEWAVKYPDHRYPEICFPDGTVYEETKTLRIFVNGVEKEWLTDWDVDRNTGLVTFVVAPPLDAILTVTGEFFTRMRFAGWTPLDLSGASSFEIPAGFDLIEVDQ